MTWLVDNHPEQADKLLAFLDEKERFQLSRFDEARRAALLGKIGEHVRVNPEDVLGSVDLHLGNVAIRSEIETAKETYARSRMFLAGVDFLKGDAGSSRLATRPDEPADSPHRARADRLVVDAKESSAESTDAGSPRR